MGMVPVAKSLEVAVPVVTEWSVTVEVVNVGGFSDTPFWVLAVRVPSKIVLTYLAPFAAVTTLGCCTALAVRLPSVLRAAGFPC